MTTPAINTPNSIISAAMVNAGKLSEGQTPTSEQYTLNFNTLNRLINLWQTQGLKLFLQTDYSITLIAGQGGQGNPYVLTSGNGINTGKPLRVQQAYYLDVNLQQRPVYPLSWDEWNRLAQHSQQGPLSQFFVDKQPLSLNIYTWLIPDAVAATGTLHLMLQQQVLNPINLTETMNFPPEWGLALCWGLADEISTGQPQTIMDRAQQRAATYRAMLEESDVEDAPTQFAPDMRQASGYIGNFR